MGDSWVRDQVIGFPVIRSSGLDAVLMPFWLIVFGEVSFRVWVGVLIAVEAV